jgi:hypothetical protein
MAEGISYAYTLPSMHTGDKCLIRVQLSDAFALAANVPKLLQRAFYVSYRVRQAPGGFDHALRPLLGGRVAVSAAAVGSAR